MDEILTEQIKATEAEIVELTEETRKAVAAFRAATADTIDTARILYEQAADREAIGYAYLRGLLAGQRACKRLLASKTT